MRGCAHPLNARQGRALLCAAALAAGLIAVPPAPAEGRSKCRAAGSKTVAANRLVRVFQRPRRDDETTRLYGCLKRTGRRAFLDASFDDEYVSSSFYANVRLRGYVVGWYHESFDVSCKGDCPPGYQPTRRRLLVRDLRRRSGRSIPVDAPPAAGAFLVSSFGAVAWARWLEHNQVEIRAHDAGGERVLDSGSIHPESLALVGATVSWSKDGVRRSAQLR